MKRLIDRVSVDAAFFKKFSPMENLIYAACLYGMSIREAREKMRQIMLRLGLKDRRSPSRWRTCPAGCSRRRLLRADSSPLRRFSCSMSRPPASIHNHSAMCKASCVRFAMITT